MAMSSRRPAPCAWQRQTAEVALQRPATTTASRWPTSCAFGRTAKMAPWRTPAARPRRLACVPAASRGAALRGQSATTAGRGGWGRGRRDLRGLRRHHLLGHGGGRRRSDRGRRHDVLRMDLPTLPLLAHLLEASPRVEAVHRSLDAHCRRRLTRTHLLRLLPRGVRRLLDSLDLEHLQHPLDLGLHLGYYIPHLSVRIGRWRRLHGQSEHRRSCGEQGWRHTGMCDDGVKPSHGL
jgi:hypothetical protein